MEFKFSNFHAANQELLTDASGNGKHFNDVWYYYDYKKSLTGVWGVKSQNTGATI